MISPSWVQIHFRSVSAVGGFIFGYDLSIIAGASLFLKEEFLLTPFWLGFAVSSAVIGCIIGPLAGGGLTDRWGRKKALYLCAVLFGISAIGTALPRTMLEFYVFRIVGGMDARDAATAFRLAVENDSARHEVLNICGDDTFSPIETRELVARHYPQVPLKEPLQGHASLLSYKKATRILGFRPRFDWRETDFQLWRKATTGC